jgi:hypothetical protein
MENIVELEWRNASEGGPSVFTEPILCITKNKNLMVLKNTMGWIVGYGKPLSNWKTLREKYGIEWWTYSKEIII